MKSFFLSLSLVPFSAAAQKMDMAYMHHTMHDEVVAFLMQQALGTSTNPAAAPMHMSMTQAGDWTLMLHGNAFANQVWQSGRQHPHDFFMELAAEYAYPIAPDTIAYLYLAPVGDPALGPVAYPHRAAAAEIPQATLSHHLQDSTHLSMNAVTAGAKRGIFGAAASAFPGREPDEHRWNLESGAIDSWSLRLTADPTPNVTAQISTGHLHNPESLEPGNTQRTTGSIAYTAGAWSSGLIFGHNQAQGRGTNSFTAETLVRVAAGQWVTARGEIVDKNELFDDGAVHRIKALTTGYTHDVWSNAAITGGGNVTVYDVPSALRTAYGSHPHSLYLYIRARNAT